MKDQKEKIAIENSIKNIQNGKIEAVVSDNIHDIRELVSTGYNKEDNFLDLVDIKDIDKLQYLNQYRDNIIKRFFQIYGIASQVTNKLAQQNNAEIHANDDVVMTLFLQRYKYRKMLVEDMNQKFGLDVSVKLSDSWMDSYNEIINNSEEQEETEEQKGDEKIIPFSFSTNPEDIQKEQISCWLTYTNEETHKIIRDNIDRSPLFSGAIEGTGPRYCPSIEDKVVRFADKNRHQVFIEPEGNYTNEECVTMVHQIIEAVDNFDGEKAQELVKDLKNHMDDKENIKALNQAFLQMDEFMYDEAKESLKKILKTV